MRATGAFADPAAEIGVAASRVERPYFVRGLFTLQSYFDVANQEGALLKQSGSEPIVASTAKLEQVPGRLLGLSPASQTPIAVEFYGKGARSEAIIMKPGQIVKPFGEDPFSEFRWGLPFGWLGGGAAYVGIAAAGDGQIWWGGGDPEVIYHRIRLPLTGLSGNPNWPMRFPWTNARRGAVGASGFQAGQPTIALNGTRLLARLNTAGLAAPGTMRVSIANADCFADATDTWVEDVVFPIGVANPVVEIGTPLAALGGDSAILTISDLDGAMVGCTVDFVRYGRL